MVTGWDGCHFKTIAKGMAIGSQSTTHTLKKAAIVVPEFNKICSILTKKFHKFTTSTDKILFLTTEIGRNIYQDLEQNSTGLVQEIRLCEKL